MSTGETEGQVEQQVVETTTESGSLLDQLLQITKPDEQPRTKEMIQDVRRFRTQWNSYIRQGCDAVDQCGNRRD